MIISDINYIDDKRAENELDNVVGGYSANVTKEVDFEDFDIDQNFDVNVDDGFKNVDLDLKEEVQDWEPEPCNDIILNLRPANIEFICINSNGRNIVSITGSLTYELN